MPVTYVSRRGDTYYLQRTTTRTGRVGHSMTRKVPAAPAEALPEGFEIHELPETGQVVVRRIKPTRIAVEERADTEAAVSRLLPSRACLVEIESDALVIYASDRDSDQIDRFVRELSGGAPTAAQRQFMMAHSVFIKMLRFSLVDEKKRRFTAERWCFLGSIDNWVALAGPAPLAKHLALYVPHLGKQSFYDLGR